jgi:hypothetical protein
MTDKKTISSTSAPEDEGNKRNIVAQFVSGDNGELAGPQLRFNLPPFFTLRFLF